MLVNQILNLARIREVMGALILLDQVKEYDRIDRSWLLSCFKAFGCGPTFINFISRLYSNNSAAIVINGYISKSFPVEQGVRQGDPLSPLLYNLALDVSKDELSLDIRGCVTKSATDNTISEDFEISAYSWEIWVVLRLFYYCEL
ncbi:uncharacterized protein VTP21DRAFT_6715 [Calcarisporiella thermophila]|uniref:uncharacterized protein n=1 Tax=Calcarisporiella thermophila TaxID=911321 RepID=UPI0037423556